MPPQSLLDALAPWASLYADSAAVATAVVAVHLCALLFGGGFAVAADQATLRALDDASSLPAQLEALARTHRAVLAWLGVMAVSGALMTAADLETYWSSTAYLVKQGLVLLLLANGALLTVTERALRRAAAGGAPLPAAQVARLRLVSRASQLLWAATAAAGVALTNFA